MAVVELNGENFAKEVLDHEGKVLIDFWAAWCAPCMMLSPVVDKVSETASDVKFAKVNVDESPDIAMKYNVMSIPTLILVENGEEKERSVGLISETELKDLIK